MDFLDLGSKYQQDKNDEFENYVNPNSVVWQMVETDYWKQYLKDLISEHFKETQSHKTHTYTRDDKKDKLKMTSE